MIFIQKLQLFISGLILSGTLFAQESSFKPDFSAPREIKGMRLVWHDEFNGSGKPDSTNWGYETGFVRNKELQWYQPNNAICKGGALVIEGRVESVKNPNYIDGSQDWKTNREYSQYTSASVITRGLHQWQYGRFEIRARIDTTMGSWPAIWTLGINKPWPSNGEIDVLEFYRVNNVPTILANTAWGTSKAYIAKWNSVRTPLRDFTARDPQWPAKFHVWRMDWTKDSIKLFLDDVLLNATLLSQTLNPDGSNPFQQPHYMILNLALGANGGEPVKAPVKYEVDYVRVYQKMISNDLGKIAL
jgi:beta-glucanase (GH16 family)